MAILEVDLSAIKNNLMSVKQLLKNNQKLCFVAKANCYGLGAKKICKFVDLDVDYFAVSSAYEFFKIKKVVTKPILILDPIYENITILAKNKAELTVGCFESFWRIFRCANKNPEVDFKIHVAVNTGMNRFGLKKERDVFKIFRIAQKTQNISICGVFSHFYEANSKYFAKNQYERFCDFANNLKRNFDTKNIIFHLCNSDGVLNFNCFDMVRTGMIMFSDLRFPTIKLKSKILGFQQLNNNETAGYGAVFVAKRKTKLAVVGIGYADGLVRNIYKKGYVLINGFKAKIVAVCMDSLLVDVTDINAKICDEVVIIGRSGDNQIFICDVAGWCDTIGYEIISKISSRVKRIYKR